MGSRIQQRRRRLLRLHVVGRRLLGRNGNGLLVRRQQDLLARTQSLQAAGEDIPTLSLLGSDRLIFEAEISVLYGKQQYSVEAAHSRFYRGRNAGWQKGRTTCQPFNSPARRNANHQLHFHFRLFFFLRNKSSISKDLTRYK